MIDKDKSEYDNLNISTILSNSLDLLVVSVACYTAINRNVYKLFMNSGWSVAIIVPEELSFSTGKKRVEINSSDDPPIILKTLKGNNSRTWHFEGTLQVLNKYHPKFILLDNDPISLMSIEIGRWSRKNGSNLFCLTCENLSLNIIKTIRRRGLMGLPSGLFKKLVGSITRNLVSGVFTINEEGTAVFKNEKFKNVHRIPLGFDPKFFRIDSDARREKREFLSLEGPVIGFLGRLVFEKGVHLLIAALAELKQYKWTLLMDEFSIYKNNYGTGLKSKINEANILDRIVFINPKHTEMGDYINAIDLVVMPSISTPTFEEQYGRVAAEAMACGKTVIAANTGALPMLLGGYGILFPEGDTIALKNILEKFLVSDDLNFAKHTPEEISAYAHEFLSINKQKQLMERSFNLSVL